MRYSPECDRRRAAVVAGTLFVLSVMLYAFASAGLRYSDVFRVISLFAFAAALFVAVRYGFTYLTYSVRPREGGDGALYGYEIDTLPTDLLDFAVIRSFGQGPNVTECLLGLELLHEVTAYSGRASAAKLKERYAGIKLYHYTARMFSSDRIVLIFEDGSEMIAVIVDLSGDMRRFLELTAKKNGESCK